MWKALVALVVIAALGVLIALQWRQEAKPEFVEIASLEIDGNAEILQATPDGLLLVHTNSKRNSVDVIDINNPEAPIALSSLDMPGEPTSVALSPDGRWALAVIHAHQSKEGKKPADLRLPGLLTLIDLSEPAKPELASVIGIGNHPDSIAVTDSGDELIAVIAIENEPVHVSDGVVIDEPTDSSQDVSPPGAIQIVSLNPLTPGNWSVNTLFLSSELLENALMLEANSPQPEYVALSPGRHMAAVSLQENNGIALIDLTTPEIVGAFSLGKVATRPADLMADDNVQFTQDYPSDADSTIAGSRFPDAIAFSPDGQHLLSADEGEANMTGGRGFSIWSLTGELIWDDGGQIEQLAAQSGMYPDDRSDKKGVEIEGIATGRFGSREFAFAVSERGSFLAIYDIQNASAPAFVQILPTGIGPESVVAIPNRNLVAVAAEESGTITLFRYEPSEIEPSPLEKLLP